MTRLRLTVAILAWLFATAAAGEGRGIDPARIAGLLEDVRNGAYEALYSPPVKDALTSMYSMDRADHAVIENTRGYLFGAVLGLELGDERGASHGAVAGLVASIAREAGKEAALALFEDYLENPQAVAKSIARATTNAGLDAYDKNLELARRIEAGSELDVHEKRWFAENHVMVSLLGAAKDLLDQSRPGWKSPYRRSDVSGAMIELEEGLADLSDGSEVLLISKIVSALDDAGLPADGYRPLRKFFDTARLRTREIVGLVVVPPVTASVTSVPEPATESTVEADTATGIDAALMSGTMPATEDLRRAKLIKLLGRDADAEWKDRNDWSDLHYAAYLNLPDTIRRVATQGGNVDAQTARDRLPMKGEVVRVLAAFGAPASEWRRDEKTPLHYAALANAADAAEMLIAHGASVDIRDGMNNTPLHSSAIAGSAEVARLLIANGADTTARGENGNTAVHFAALSDAPEVLEVLLGWNAHTKLGCKDERYISMECLAGVWDYVSRARPNARNNDRKTPLDLAREKQASRRTMDMLVKVKPEEADNEGR